MFVGIYVCVFFVKICSVKMNKHKANLNLQMQQKASNTLLPHELRKCASLCIASFTQ